MDTTRLKDDSDEQLMTRYRNGNEGAFAVLYDRHKGPLFRFVCRQAGDRARGEEIFQDIWIKLIKARHRYEVRAGFRTFLYHIAHNRLRDHFRSCGREQEYLHIPEDEASPADPLTDPQRLANNEDCIEKMLSCIEALPLSQRQVFLLRHEGGLAMQEIADATDSGVEAVKSRYRYALSRLRGCLREFQP